MAESPSTLRLVVDRKPDEEPAPPVTLEEAYERYARYVATIAFRLLGSDADVDDVVQDVFVEAMKRLSTIEDPAALRAWLATIAVRVASRRLRRRRLAARFGFGPSIDYERVASREASPDDRVMIALLYETLDGLPVAERVAWTLRHVEGEQLQAVAQLCGCSLATAKRRIAAADNAIAEALDDG